MFAQLFAKNFGSKNFCANIFANICANFWKKNICANICGQICKKISANFLWILPHSPMKSMNVLEHQTIENRIPRQIKMDLTKRETDVVQ